MNTSPFNRKSQDTDHERVSRAQAWARAEAPTIWLLGKTQAGKTSIVAEIVGKGHDEIGQGFLPMTKSARLYAFPEERPVLRFLDTRGLGDVADYDPTTDLQQASRQAQVILVVTRATDLAIEEVLATLARVRREQPDRPVLVAQSCLHQAYARHDRHPLPYPFTGEDSDFALPGLPDELRQAMQAQRKLFADLPGKLPPVFVPLDFTRPEQGVPPSDYGAQRLWDVLESVLLETVVRLRAEASTPLPERLRLKVMLPWAFAAAAANAVPAPILGGLGSASLQALMVNQIARRCGVKATLDQWGAFVTTLGPGFALGFGGRWAAQQVLKLGIGWGSALVAAWTFAITWGIGEAALYYFAERAAGREPDPKITHARYLHGIKEARTIYEKRKEPTQ
ncbi:GTPase family protein [Thiorhodovibrio frisius]|uniref:Uncharacterized protein associated with GTPases n=1 Tax=Thiorhodovibrio frisius TaxID=631362 RepID=H8YVD2_9GAMM|nr:GTPase [Thiorhodovibrio frisius]EIC23872.1 uncharacterized protein associated with GTPases [Thiorhodovibrio frisius]WPL23115.1 GTPase [Thiorhodovibrio frisius]